MCTVYREHRIDDGFKAKNTATMIVGIGRNKTVRAVNVRWLSGVEQTEANVPAGQLITVYEDPSHSPTGQAFVLVPYGDPDSRGNYRVATSRDDWRLRLLPREPSNSTLTVQETGQTVSGGG